VPKVKEGEVTADIFGFLTFNPNAEVGAICPKAMPVILRTAKECEAWMSAPWAEAAKLQRPLPDGSLQIVVHGARKDEAA
jgi:putative SOS response-associated peptidase YedK